MPVPSNITPATATVISTLPFTSVLDVTDAPESLTNVPSCVARAWNAVWYRYTASPGVIFLYINGNLGSGSNAGYFPSVSLWTGPVGSLTQFSITTYSGTLSYCRTLYGGFYYRVPVTPGTTYYIQIVHDDTATAPSTSILSLNVQEAPALAAPAQSIVIPDVIQGFPAAVLGLSTGTFLQFPAFPPGEFTDTLPTGEVCTQYNEQGTTVAFLDASFNTVTTYSLGADFLGAIKSNRVDAFYVLAWDGSAMNSTLRKFSAAGVLQDSWSLPTDFDNAPMCAVARDDGKWFAATATANTPIHVYNLSTRAQIADLAVGVAAQSFTGSGDGYVAQDGSLLLMRKTSSAFWVDRFDTTSGAVLQTYNPTSADRPWRFCFCDDSPGSLVIWGYIFPTTNNNAVFERIKLSDGSSLSQVTGVSVITTSEVSRANNPNGISNTCPVFVLAAALAAPDLGPPEPSYHTTTLIRRRLRRAPILWAEKDGLQTRVRVNLFAVDMEPATATSDTPEPLVMVRASKDGGHTFGDWRNLSAGKVGEYTKRLNAWRWGSGRQWVFEVATSDPVTFNLINAYIDAEPGNS